MDWNLFLQGLIAVITAVAGYFIVKQPDPNTPPAVPPVTPPASPPVVPVVDVGSLIAEKIKKALSDDGKISLAEWVEIGMASGSKLLEVLARSSQKRGSP